jgi:HD-GYP domain-containing protein (c-di-GMP phosphodiesterase class II)
MRLINILSAKPEDVLGRSILSKDGGIMLKQGVSLTKRYIEKLVDLSADCIYIEDDILTDIMHQDEKFLEIKSDVVKLLSKSFIRLEKGNNELELKDTVEIIATLTEYLLDNKELSNTQLTEIKTYDNYTYVHSLNTCVVSLFFGIHLSYSMDKLIDLGVAALLHDIGKTKIPKYILNKKEKLTDDEFNMMKQHSIFGYEMLNKLNYISKDAKRAVLEHHERINGSGYPESKRGPEISELAKILAISDVYDALISDRSYKKGIDGYGTYEIILSGAGVLFDWNLVNLFRQKFSIYPLGVCVKLSDGQEGFVVKDNKGFPDRPIIRIIYDNEGNAIPPFEVDLIDKINVCIERMVL